MTLHPEIPWSLSLLYRKSASKMLASSTDSEQFLPCAKKTGVEKGFTVIISISTIYTAFFDDFRGPDAANALTFALDFGSVVEVALTAFAFIALEDLLRAAAFLVGAGFFGVDAFLDGDGLFADATFGRCCLRCEGSFLFNLCSLRWSSLLCGSSHLCRSSFLGRCSFLRGFSLFC